MESSDLKSQLVKAIKEGKLTLKEVEDELKKDKIPEDILETFHLLFCNRNHIKGSCSFYDELLLTSKDKQSAHIKWTNLAKLYMSTFGASTEDLKNELSDLKNILQTPNRLGKFGLIAVYSILFNVTEEFITNFVQLLNEDEPITE
jgi:hypothetical protein